MREHINFFLAIREHVHWGMQVWSTKNIEYVFFLCMLVSKPYIIIVFICVMQEKNGGGGQGQIKFSYVLSSVCISL